jgi:hypothetical protein
MAFDDEMKSKFMPGSEGRMGLFGIKRVVRPPRATSELLQLRERNQMAIRATRQIFLKFLEHIKEEHRDHNPASTGDPPVVDLLFISGGGDKGAFGSGFLKGWGHVPKTHPLCRPEFEVVTGVSTGALIAPFAFLGGEWVDRIDHLYRNPKKDWIQKRTPFYFLPMHISFADIPGLERDVRETVTVEMAKKIVGAGKSGRLLIVNTTNLDDDSPRVFFLVPEAKLAVETGDLNRLSAIMLASAGIPGVLPYREVDGEMYVDGGVTANIIYGGRLGEEDSLPALWQEAYGLESMPKFRYWVIFNNQIHKPPSTVPARWPEIFTRAMELATRAASVAAMRHLHAMAEISRLKRNADVEVRIVAIPNEWTARVEGSFRRETMNELADIGEKMGEDPGSWSTEPPPP